MSRAARFIPLAVLLAFVGFVTWRLLVPNDEKIPSRLTGRPVPAFALESATEGVPGLAIHLELPPRFSVDDPKRAQVLLRCAQEIITNTVRHAGARNLWLRFERNDDRQMVIHARDDGRGAKELKPGNGLAGMRERLAQYGGRLDIVTGKDQGFALDAWLPLEGAA